MDVSRVTPIIAHEKKEKEEKVMRSERKKYITNDPIPSKRD